jgi:DNA-nicking Smr family endonuclease
MSRDGGKPDNTSRRITPDEAELWSRTTLSVEKVKVKPRVAAHAAEPAPPSPKSRTPEPALAKRRPAAPKIAPARAQVASSPPAPVAELDRRAFRKVATGKIAIDATLDLHGLQQGDAHARLRAFLRNSQAQGLRMVLVITGKGGSAAETGDDLEGRPGRPERGILRRKVPQWLGEPELGAIVVGYVAAGLRHGGSGALYVRLRKARETT